MSCPTCLALLDDAAGARCPRCTAPPPPSRRRLRRAAGPWRSALVPKLEACVQLRRALPPRA